MTRYRPTSEILGWARRTVRAAGRCVAIRGLEGPDDLAELADLAREVDEALVAAVAGLRAQGCSWQVIADSLHVSRQTAWARFADLREVKDPQSPEGARTDVAADVVVCA